MKITTTIKTTPKERKAALKTIAEIRALLKNGDNWITGDEERPIVDDDGNDTGEVAYCLWGAAKEADGPGEDLVVLVLAFVIEKQNTNKEYESFYSGNGDINMETVEGAITDYNDHVAAAYKDISKILTKAEKLLQKEVISI